MEYCALGDLYSLLETQPGCRFEEATALALFRQIVAGVAFLHSVDIAHRDVSLENVLLSSRMEAKICDFGLSTSASQWSSEAVGKLYYMAPEVVRGEVYDPVLSDVWALGIVLFVMLTGSPLFRVAEPTDPAWDAMRRVGVAGILRRWQVQVSPSTEYLLSRMLQLDPRERMPSVASVARKLG
ncbi:hypothetical protein PINS_up020922 [Pythium insidiosum]|nr:hypothetical protein PINS_up013042 [Pythium insidiosum]GLE04132.1 hypothetical protein PINS_up013043 [Pythium insidiosum]GLE09313.1 hypothetical protein PINS_up020922 [Pythium insidiosum]